MRQYADRVKNIEPFRVVEVLTKAKEMEARGIDVIHMGGRRARFCHRATDH